MKTQNVGVLIASAFLFPAISLQASLVPGNSPCSFPKTFFLSNMVRELENSPSTLKAPGLCAQEVQSFIKKDPLYRRRWKEASGNPIKEERLLKEVNSLFYHTGKNLQKTLKAAKKFGRLSAKGRVSPKSMSLTPWLIGHEAQVVKKNLKALNLAVKKAGPHAKLSWFSPQWQESLDLSLGQAQRQYALFIAQEQKQAKARQEKLALAKRHLNKLSLSGKNFDDPALNSTLDSNTSPSPHPAGSSEAGAVMAVFLGQKVLNTNGQATGK